MGIALGVIALALPVSPASAKGHRVEKVFSAVNAVRQQGHSCGGRWMPAVPRLRWNPRLARAADRYAATMASNSWFDHVGPNGATLTSRARSAGYRGFAAGENIASGQPTAASVVAAWLASPGHCENLMRRSFDEVGVGFARHRVAGYSTPVTYWVQDFGSR